MTIGRVTTNVDLYSLQRTDVYLHGRTTGRQPPPTSEKGTVGARHARQSAELSLDGDDGRRSRRWQEADGGVVVPFDPPNESVDQQPTEGDTAEAVPLELEVGDGLRDPFLAQVAQLYSKNGRRAFDPNSETIGTRLNAVA